MSLSLPFTLENGTTADANQVMADFNSVVDYINNNLQLNLSLPLSVAQGGTGATAGAAALINLGGLSADNNLSDVESPSEAAFNIGALQVGNNLSDVNNASTALANLGGLAIANNLDDVASAVTALNNLLPSQTSAAGQVLTSDGTNASWETPGAFTYAQFQNQQASGTNSGESLTSGAWGRRVLNTTVFSTIAGASISGNQISLPAGTYLVTATATAQASANTENYLRHQLRLWNATDSLLMCTGPNFESQIWTSGSISQPYQTAPASLQGRFVLSVSKTIELDSWIATDDATGASGGTAFSTGGPEVYVDLLLTKIA